MLTSPKSVEFSSRFCCGREAPFSSDASGSGPFGCIVTASPLFESSFPLSLRTDGAVSLAAGGTGGCAFPEGGTAWEKTADAEPLCVAAGGLFIPSLSLPVLPFAVPVLSSPVPIPDASDVLVAGGCEKKELKVEEKSPVPAPSGWATALPKSAFVAFEVALLLNIALCVVAVTAL